MTKADIVNEKMCIRDSYNVSLMRHLKADSHYVWFTLIISLILIIVFYRFTQKLGMSITKLQQFAMKADRNERCV